MLELEAENHILRREINRELQMTKKHVIGGAPEYKLRVREENKLQVQRDTIKEQIEEQEIEIQKIKKSQRYTNYQELRMYVEELQEETMRLKKLNKKMKQTREAEVPKMIDRIDSQEMLMANMEDKLNGLTRELESTKNSIKATQVE